MVIPIVLGLGICDHSRASRNLRAPASMPRNLPLICLTALTLISATETALAFTIFGIRLWGDDEPAREIDVIDPLHYAVDLVMADDTADLRGEMEAASNLIRGADRPALGRSGLLASANGDYGRMLDALYASGHYGATVSIRINGQEAAGIPLDASIGDNAKVAIQVDPGPLFRFGRAAISDLPGANTASGVGIGTGNVTDNVTGTGSRTGSGTLPGIADSFATGAPALSGTVGDAARRAVAEWAAAGHAKADVAAVDATADHASATLDVTIELDPGPRAHFGQTQVTGTEALDPEFVAYMANLEPGRVYDGTAVARARQRLLKMDTFRSVEITQAKDIAADGSLDMIVAVEDRRPRRLGVGVTLSSLDGITLEGFWLHRNLGNRAQRLRFDGKVSNIGFGTAPKDYDYTASVAYIQPGMFNPDTDFRLGLTAEQEKIGDYTSLTLTTSAGLSTQFSDRLSGDIALVNERSWTNNDLGDRRFSLTGIEAGVTYDSRDRPLDATRGIYLAARAFPFYELHGDNFGLQTDLEARVYRALDQDSRFVLAGRARYGAVSGVALLDAPPQVLFLSGGGGSVRGYAYRSNGVVVPGGVKLGGRSVVEASGELRMRINEQFSMVGFMDAGLVGPDPTPDFDGEIKTSLGVGVRLNTGLGPIRFDFARGLDRSASDPAVGVYIGLGQAF